MKHKIFAIPIPPRESRVRTIQCAYLQLRAKALYLSALHLVQRPIYIGDSGIHRGAEVRGKHHVRSLRSHEPRINDHLLGYSSS